VWRVNGLLNIAAGADAWIKKPAIAKLLKGALIKLKTLALENWIATPSKSEPGEVLNCGLNKLSTAAGAIQIIHAQKEFAARCARPHLRNPERAGMTEMKKTGRRRRDASAI
jgi:hypothetical protein